MKTELIDQYNMLPEGCAVLCAVSGGADSMCLLYWLNELRAARGFSVFAAHFEHGLRGEESLQDAVFTQEQCAALAIPCELGRGDVAAFSRRERIGTEEDAVTVIVEAEDDLPYGSEIGTEPFLSEKQLLY